MEQNIKFLGREILNIRTIFTSMNSDINRTKSLFKEIVDKSKEVTKAYSNDELEKNELEIGCVKVDDLATFFEQMNSDLENLLKPLLELTDSVLLFHFKNTLSSNILTLSQAKDLIYLIDMPVSTKWQLIYWANRDGFGAKDFHYHCDNKPNLLVMIKSEDGCIFGGFTEVGWSSSNRTTNDPKAFLFSLINNQNKPIKMMLLKSSANSVYYDQFAGPIFGYLSHFEFELYIADNSNTNSTSRIIPRSIFLNKNILTGSDSEYFKVSDIEVFQIIELK